MAAKKKSPAKKPAAPAKKAAKAAPKRADRLAVKLLANLPALDDKRRKAYRAAFTEAQCEAWGAQTKAEQVLSDAEKVLGAVHGRLRGGVIGYSAYRLSWLCHLLADLEDAITTQSSADGTEARAERNAAVAVATRARKRLVAGLSSMAGGDAALRAKIADRAESSTTPHALESSLTGLMQLAMQWRRSEHGEVLGDDAGVSDTFLSSVSAVVDSLREANEHTYGEGGGHDSAETNRIEGRVLRELSFLRRALAIAKELGEAAPAFPTPKSLASAEGRGNGAGTSPVDEDVGSPS